MGLNQKNENLAKPEVREAMKYLVDYQTIADTIMNGKVKVHQAFLPEGFLGALNDNPYSLNVEKAKELLAAAGLEDGFSVTMDTRNTPEITAIAEAIQQTMAEAGIQLELIPGDGQQTLTKYRARNHDIYIGRWGPDYQDPHTNADTFARNPDNSDDATSKPLAWRNAWDIPDMTAKADAAVLEKDADARAEMYLALQKEHQEVSPFVIMFQEIEVLGIRDNVDGFIIGPSFNDNSFRKVTKKRMTATSPANEGGRWRALPTLGMKAGKLIATVAITFLGLLVVTFPDRAGRACRSRAGRRGRPRVAIDL